MTIALYFISSVSLEDAVSVFIIYKNFIFIERYRENLVEQI